MTLAFENANSNLLDVLGIGIADIYAEECVDDSLVEILKLKFGQDIEAKFCSDFEHQV